MSLFDIIFKKERKARGSKSGVGTSENINGIFIKYKKHRFSKYIKITPKNTGEVLVTLPCRVSYAVAKEFVLKNMDWIQKTIATQSKTALSPDIIAKRRKLAHTILPKRLEELALKYGFKYGKVFIKNQKTVWGSCSFKNNINLNLNLVALGDEYIDYVLLHELTHTVHKNHQKAFYELLVKNMPNALEIQKKLKKIKIGVLGITS